IFSLLYLLVKYFNINNIFRNKKFDSNLFTKTSVGLTLGQKFKNILFETIQESQCFDRLEKFLTNTYVMISPSFASYISGQPIASHRIIIAGAIKMTSVLFII